MLHDLLKMVFIQIKKRKMRSFLTIVQVMIGIATITLIFSLVFNVWDAVGNNQEGEGENLYQLQIGTREDSENGNIYTYSTDSMSLADIKFIKDNVDTIAALTPLNRHFDSLIESDQYYRIRQIAEVGPDFFGMADVTLEEGSFFTTEDFARKNQVAVVSKSAARQIFSEVNPIGQKIKVENDWRYGGREEATEYIVIGLFSQENKAQLPYLFNNNPVYIPASITRTQTNNHTSVTYKESGEVIEKIETSKIKVEPYFHSLYIKIEDGQYTATEAALASVFTQLNKEGEVILTTQKQQQAGFTEGLNIITLILGIFGFLILVIGSIGILSTMMINILERTRQIGIEKALGASKRLVFIKFNLESIFIAFIGGLGGMTVAFFLMGYVSHLFTNFPVPVDNGLHPLAILVAGVVSIAAGWLVGIYPSYQAANLQVTEALGDNN